MTDNRGLRQASYTIICGLAILLVISIIFYKERVFFADAAYVIFNIINFGNLAIQVNRYGSFITQLTPFLGQKLGLPLKLILIAYAGSFSFFYLVVVLLLGRMRQYSLAILAGLFYFLIVSESFYWVNEIPQGAGWMFLMFGLTIFLGKKGVNVWLIAIPFALLAVLTLFTHFVLLMPTAFLWLFLIAEKKNWPFSKRNTALLSMVLIAVALSKFLVIFSGPTNWDAMHLHGFTHISLKDIFQAIGTPVVKMFAYRCITNYWAALALLVLGVVFLIRRKDWWPVMLVLFGCIGYSVIMGLSYGDLDKNVLLFHIESEWMCIGIIMAAPFAFYVLPQLKPHIAVISLSGVLVVRIAYILAASSIFSWRVHFQNEVLEQMKHKGITKLAIQKEFWIQEKYLIDWATGYEALLRSASHKDKPNLTFFFINTQSDKDALGSVANPSNIYLWESMPVGDLNKRYFDADSTHPYTIMTYSELMK